MVIQIAKLKSSTDDFYYIESNTGKLYTAELNTRKFSHADVKLPSRVNVEFKATTAGKKAIITNIL